MSERLRIVTQHIAFQKTDSCTANENLLKLQASKSITNDERPIICVGTH